MKEFAQKQLENQQIAQFFILYILYLQKNWKMKKLSFCAIFLSNAPNPRSEHNVQQKRRRKMTSVQSLSPEHVSRPVSKSVY